MSNRFIACGGTGAHVMLAMVRLHILGYPFGFFFKAGNIFPDLFLVDQDSGFAKDPEKSTAWQEVKHLIRVHPGKYDLVEYLGRPDEPICRDVSPLPVGEDKDWFKPPHHQLEFKFKNSQILELITSQEQREIKYDHGMMASPSAGALLFSLKELDCDDGGINYDEYYDEMIHEPEKYRIMVCGSSVGGTGSSVAPTLARLCKGKGAEVMAVMIHNWFKFTKPDDSRETYEKADERNERMNENAAGGLACYGDKLAELLPTVLVGVPNQKIILRNYTGDNQQTLADSSYAHVVGALAGIKHFFVGGDGKIKKGLYGISASDDSSLTGDIIIRDRDGASLKLMVGHAQILTYLLEVFSKLLRTTSKRNPSKIKSSLFDFFTFAGEIPFPSVAHWAYVELSLDHSRLGSVAKELDSIVKEYKRILTWIKEFNPRRGGGLCYDTDHVERKSKSHFLPEIKCVKRLENHPLPKIAALPKTRRSNFTNKEEIVASALFHWAADWITDDWAEVGLKSKPKNIKLGRGYWPETISRNDGGLVPNWTKPGELGKVADGNVAAVVQNYFRGEDVTPNSWPHPFSVTEQYKFQISNKDPEALHHLEILLIARAIGILEFQKVNLDHNHGKVSIENLIKDENIAEYRLIHKDSGKVYGFNSPQTLLCPVQDRNDEDWNSLRGQITRNPDKEKARKCVKGWLECTQDHIKDIVNDVQSRTWVDVFDIYFQSETGTFGVAEWLPLPGARISIPIPIIGDSTGLLGDIQPDKKEAKKRYQKFLNRVPEFKECGTNKSGKQEIFQLIEDFRLPGSEFPIKAIWREHLDALQESRKIFAWEKDQTDKGIWIREKLSDDPIYVTDIQVIDIEKIRIHTCIPLEQKPVPGSSNNREIKYPDIPLRPEYIDLLKIPEGKTGAGGKCINQAGAWRALEQSGKVYKERKEVHWELDLLGRSNPVTIIISLQKVKPSRAHWMVWPNIKSSNTPDLWKAYYVYAHSERDTLRAQIIYLDKDGNLSRAIKAPPSCPGNSYALDFRNGQHVGGPPVALSSYDDKLKDTGIYIIGLQEYAQDKKPWKIAIDFGTSHTVAAYQIDVNQGPKPVNLDAEFNSANKLSSLHVSENYDDEDISKMGLDLWRPTYYKKADRNDGISKALLPSDLWSVTEKSQVDLTTFKSDWSPITHYSIPVMNLKRSSLRDHVISGFKWDLKFKPNDQGPSFTGEEPWLRERYLRMSLEIFIADIVKNTGKLPKQIETTFTYPLRGTFTGDTAKYQNVINKVLTASNIDFGFKFYLFKGQGMYSESHAAYESVGKGVPINVKIVADLGGGTLDILIATHDIQSDSGHKRFKEVVDSVGIGSDCLLEILAGDTETYLPRNSGWAEQDPERAFEQLRAWMRSRGSQPLFGMGQVNAEDPDLGLRGFGKPQDGNHARKLIDRYFQVIVDFLSRYLVAYLTKDVLPVLESPEDRDKLKILVNLRGNGWRLWHGKRDYGDIQKKMEKRVKSRVSQLWGDLEIDDILPDKVWHKADLILSNSPKIEPIKNAVGKSMNPKSALDIGHRFPLSCVEILRRGEPDRRKDWDERLPFEGVGEKDDLCIYGFDPPLIMREESGRPLVNIEDPLMKKINEKISGSQAIRDGNRIDAPIASMIWESLLESNKFRKV